MYISLSQIRNMEFEKLNILNNHDFTQETHLKRYFDVMDIEWFSAVLHNYSNLPECTLKKYKINTFQKVHIVFNLNHLYEDCMQTFCVSIRTGIL